MSWNPEIRPDPEAWLALDEQERIELIEEWHRRNPSPALHSPNVPLRAHAAMHAVVETQIASGEPPITGQTVERLMDAGLRRHAALHAVLVELAQEIAAASREGGYRPERYERALHALRPEDAIPMAGLDWMNAAPDPEEVEAPRNRAERRKAARDKRRRKGS